MEEFTEIRQQFLNSLTCGTGEAYFIQKNNPQIDFSDLIIKGAITNFAFDKQCEGSRADYIYSLIQASTQKDKIIKTALKKLQIKKRDNYDLAQLCDLAVKFYRAGYPEAKAALYNRFEKNNTEGYDFCGQAQLMTIDGISGALKVATVVGQYLLEHPGEYEDSWRMDEFQKKNKTVDVYAALKEASLKNECIKAYYESILQHQWKRRRARKIPRFTYELIKENMKQGRLAFLSSERNQELTDAEVARLASEFLTEKDVPQKEKYLRFFCSRKFPFDYQPIFRLAIGEKGARLVATAIEALKHFSSKEIRDLALEKLKTAAKPAEYLYLLINNYKSGDAKLLTELVNRSDDYNYIHELVYGLIEIYEANAVEECREPLEVLYNKMNCGIHRNAIVRVLIANGVLSEKIFREIAFDSYCSTRKLHRQHKKRYISEGRSY